MEVQDCPDSYLYHRFPYSIFHFMQESPKNEDNFSISLSLHYPLGHTLYSMICKMFIIAIQQSKRDVLFASTSLWVTLPASPSVSMSVSRSSPWSMCQVSRSVSWLVGWLVGWSTICPLQCEAVYNFVYKGK